MDGWYWFIDAYAYLSTQPLTSLLALIGILFNTLCSCRRPSAMSAQRLPSAYHTNLSRIPCPICCKQALHALQQNNPLSSTSFCACYIRLSGPPEGCSITCAAGIAFFRLTQQHSKPFPVCFRQHLQNNRPVSWMPMPRPACQKSSQTSSNCTQRACTRAEMGQFPQMLKHTPT